MKEMLKRIKENKALMIIWNTIYTIVFIIVLLMLILVVLQRTTNNQITIGGVRIFTVVTGSMIPKYQVGDVLVSIETNPEKLKVGDDIVYKGEVDSFKGKIVTHQIISIEKEDEGYKLKTKGIANETEDPEITDKQVLGKIIYKIKFLSVMEKLSSNLYTFYFLIFVPIVLLTFKQITGAILKEDEEESKNKQDDENEEDDEDEDEIE